MSENNRPTPRHFQEQPASRFDDPGRSQPRRQPARGQSRPGGPSAPAGPQAGGSRPAPKPRRMSLGPASGPLPRGFLPLALVCVAILALGVVLQGLLPNGFALTSVKDSSERPVAAQVSEIHGDGPVRLNEVMSANGGVLVDATGGTPDWVEVANVSSRPVNLKGYILAKSAKAGNVFVFPDAILQPGECAIVFADSTLQAQLGEELHAPFRLSSGGDVLMLFNDADVAVDTVNLPALSENEAYARVDRNTWAATAQATPGLQNSEENYLAMTSVVQDSPVRLAQIVASNSQYAPDESGVFHDYVVLSNSAAEAVDIGGWYLSDNPRLPRLWKFPAGVSIPAGGRLLVYCSGLNRVENPERLHTSFRLSSEGETVTLSNASGQPVDSVTYDLLKTDQAYVRGGDGSWSIGTPSGN